jgi:uncharacterized membrane protein HdeD (DUF308 family)
MGKGSGIHIEGVALGVLAIVAGILVLWNPSIVTYVVGIFLIVFGVLTILKK